MNWSSRWASRLPDIDSRDHRMETCQMELPGATQPSKDAMKQMVSAVDRKAFIELPNGHGAQLRAAVKGKDTPGGWPANRPRTVAAGGWVSPAR